MGILDPPAIPSVRRRPYNLVDKLERGVDNAVLTLLGDSTANANDEWFYLLVQKLAQRYPAYRVLYRLWNDPTLTLGSGSYNAASTVSTGRTAGSITDNFARADGALGTTPSGQTYTSIVDLSISAGKVIAGSGAAMATLDVGQANYAATASFTLPASTYGRIYLRWVDATNGIFAEVNSGTGAIYLYKRVAGTVTNLAAMTGISGIVANSTQALTASINDRILTASVGANSISYTLTAAEADILSPPTLPATSVVFYFGAASVIINSVAVSLPAPVLNVWNASTSGRDCNYSRLRLNQQIPESPDLLMVNYGHNESGSNCAPQYLSLGRAALDAYPQAQLVAVGQNPRAKTSSDYYNGLKRNSTILRLAARESWGYVPITQCYLDNPSYATDWLLEDGLHPNPAGSVVWAEEVDKHLQPKPATPAVAVERPPARLFFDPTQFVVAESTPTLGVLNTLIPGWTFDPTTQQGLLTSVDIPTSWTRVHVWLLLTTQTNSGLTPSTNVSVWEVSTSTLADPTMITDATTVAAASGGMGVRLIPSALAAQAKATTGHPNSAAGYHQPLKAVSNLVVGSSRPLAVRVRRLAADALDTYANPVTFYGLVVEKIE